MRVETGSGLSGSRLAGAMAIAAAALAIFAFALRPEFASADDWPQFRGPTMDGIIKDNPNLPEKWGTTENVEWKTEIPGLGWSSPVTWGNKVFLTTVVADGKFEQPKTGLYLPLGREKPPQISHSWFVYCLDLESGKVLWRKLVHEGVPNIPRHPKNTYASETPTTDGEQVYALFGDLGLFCFDMNGNELWKVEIAPQKTRANYGSGASPIIYDGKVIVVYDNEEASWIAAFDPKTGKEIWKTPRKEITTWATPYIWKNELRTEVVTSGQLRIRSYDLDGKLLWDMEGRMSHMTIPTPFSSHGLLYVNSGCSMESHRPIYAIRPGASGDITLGKDETSNKYVAWYKPVGSARHPSSIVCGDYFYSLFDEGFLTCHDARNGKEVYGKQRLEPGATFTSSPWAYNGKIFCLSEEGDTYVVEQGAKFGVAGKNTLDEMCMASPAVVGSRLIIRTASKVYSIKK